LRRASDAVRRARHLGCVRTCKRCAYTGPEFYRGNGNVCKECVKAAGKARYRAEPERAKAASRAWHHANRERANAERKERYRRNNPEVKRVHGQDPETMRAKHLAARRAKRATPEGQAAMRRERPSREQRAADARRYYRQNLEKARRQGREAQLRRRLGHNPEAIEYAAILQADLCAYCGGPAGHIDHIQALAAGGSNEWDNFTAACQRCNSAKNARPLLYFLATWG